MKNFVKTIIDTIKKATEGTKEVPLGRPVPFLRLRPLLATRYLLLAILITSVPIILHAGNLLTNGNFETADTSGWSTSGTAIFGVDSSTRIGSYSAKITTDTSTTGNKWLYQNVNSTAGWIYNLAGYVWKNDSNGDWIGIAIKPPPGNGYSTTTPGVSASTLTASDSSSWQFLNMSTSVAVGGLNGINIGIRINSTGGWTTGYFDNIYFGQPSSPTALVQLDGSGNQITSMQWTNSSTIISSFTLDGSVSSCTASGTPIDCIKFYLEITSVTTGGDVADWSQDWHASTSTLMSEGTTGYQWPTLTQTATYWWRVWAEDKYNGVTGSTATTLGSGATVSKFGFDATPPAQVSDLTGLTGTNDGEVKLSWTSPGDDGATGNISGGQYDLRYSTNPIGNGTDFSNIPANYRIVKPTDTTPNQGYSMTVTGLNPGTSFYFALKYKDESNNWASWSTGTYTNTASTAAAQDLPPNAVVTSTAVGSNTKITLTWTYPAAPAGDVNDYDKFWVYRSSASFAETERNNSNYVFVVTTAAYLLGNQTTFFVDTGLTNLTTYYYHISIFDKGDQGQGLYSIALESFSVVERSTIPWQSPPNAPTGFTGVAQSTYSIKWSWTDVADESGYRVRYTTSSAPADAAASPSLVTNTTYWTESNLKANTSYYRVVVATNAAGESPLSNPATTYTLAAPPLPTASTFTLVGYSSVTVNWSNNPDNPAWTRYGVIYSTSPEFVSDGVGVSTAVTFVQNLTNNTTTVFGLSAETSYWFRIIAFNEDQIQTAYIQSSTMTKVGPPTAPSNLKISALLGTTSIYWKFNDNSTNETGLYLSSGTETTMRLSENLGPFGGTGTTYWIEVGLSTNTAYTRYAEATNASGSVWSASITSYTAAAPITIATATTNNSSSIKLEWSANDNPSPATKYGVKYATATDFYVSTTAYNFASGLTAATTIVYNLSANTTYWFRVWAYNGDGIETAYVEKSTTTAPVPVFSEGIECTEIMYDPPTISNDSGGEWLEFYNNTGGPINLTGWTLTVGPDSEPFSQRAGWGDITAIPDKKFFVISEPNGTVSFADVYGGSDTAKYCAVTNNTLNMLNSAGEQIVLMSAVTGGTTYQNFVYFDNATDTSIEKTDISADETLTGSWIASLISTGTPFAAGQTVTAPPDTTPPAAISDLTALTGTDDGQIILQWTSPGDDGTVGNLTGTFRINYSSVGIVTADNFTNTSSTFATVVDISTTTLTPLTACTTTLFNLDTGTAYWFAIKARDEISTNWSVWKSTADTPFTQNTSAYIIVPKNTPAAISDLTALTGSDDGRIILMWTSPGDDGTVGNLTGAFEIKYSSISQITNSNYSAPPSPTYTVNITTTNLAPLTACTTTLILTQSTTYWFAIKVRDEVSTNWSVWNSSADFTGNTSAYAVVQIFPPNQISDLSALTGTNDGEVKLNWTAPGDDGTVGNISGGAYWVKYSTNPLGNENLFTSAATFTVQSTNTVTQQPYSTMVTGLNPGTSYYFAMKYRDEVVGNWASWSTGTYNTLSSTASQDSPPAAPSGLTSLSSNAKITLTWNSVSASDLAQYNIYRDSWAAGASYVLIASTPAGSTSFVDTGLRNNNTYYYRITAVDKGDQGNGLYSIALESPYSTSVSTAPFLMPPVLVSAEYSGNSVSITWTDSPDRGDANFSAYKLYRGTVLGGPYQLIASPTGTSYSDTPIIQAVYYYVLTSSDTDGAESVYSNEKVANPDSIPPTITHSTITTINVLGGYAIFTATITDNTQVVSAQLWWRLGSSGVFISTGVVSVSSNTYTFKLGPLDSSYIGNFNYYIEAKDAMGNTNYSTGAGSTTPTNVTVDIKTTLSVGSGGGTITVPDGDQTDGETSITIPSGAIGTNVPIAIEQKGYTGEPPPVAFQNEQTATIQPGTTGPIVCFNFEPTGTKFKKPVLLTLRYLDQKPDQTVDNELDDRPGIKESTLRIYWWDNWEWRYVGGTVNTSANTVSAYIDHFTLFALFPKGAIPIKPTAKEKFLTPAWVDGKNDRIQFECETALKKIEIYDVTGKLLKTIDNGSDNWDGTDDDGNVLESGVYIYKVEAVSGEKRTGAVVLAK